MDITYDLDLFSGLDTLPGAQKIQGNDRNIAEFKVGLDYSDITKSLGAVDNEEGYHVYAKFEEDYAHNQAYSKLYAGLDFGFALPWGHSSVWMYNAAGGSLGNRSNALDYFFMGAFGNNFVDDREVKRYRDYDSFPGLPIDDFSARYFFKSTGEFNFPPIRFDDLGNEAFYVSSVRPALFGGVLLTDVGDGNAHAAEDLGFQLDWNFTVAVRLPMTLSIGDAIGVENNHVRRNEIMVSLKIL
jgi:hypothetical protein